jgi:hypothetical protein
MLLFCEISLSLKKCRVMCHQASLKEIESPHKNPNAYGGSGRTNDQADRQRANQTGLTNKQPENRRNRTMEIITAI